MGGMRGGPRLVCSPYLTGRGNNIQATVSVATVFPIRIRIDLLLNTPLNPDPVLAVERIRIRDPVPFQPLDPGPGVGKKSGSRSGIRIRDVQPGSYF
jgi:hypothetical protein